ncbi:MAG: polysaccharide deacetylase family protein [Endomicrobium sp.]|uniref:polysaccharide deacetylase family protein n=1 Tax=Candidatus Endomicrobiellum pyrsonymphae TaxID=1408203 RepID=UPI0035818A87|nr:polysaccharide deacetylase family protein [Endomicrobium sp.]
MKKIIVLILLFYSIACFAQTKMFYADGSEDVKKISLTFDDGPGKATKQILEILEEKNVKATFFMLGARVVDDPETAKAVVAAGHEIGNHTYEHINFYAYKDEDKAEKIEKELLQCEEVIKSTLGIQSFLARFPYGYMKSDAIEATKKHNYYLINWSFGTDWQDMSAEEMHVKYKQTIKNGAIFLMHDLSKNKKVLSFLGTFIDEIKEKGYEIVTVSELLNLT